MEEEKYYNKYLKYKNKYLELKNNELLYNILNGGMKKNITLEEITLEEILERINHYNTVSNTYKQYEEELNESFGHTSYFAEESDIYLKNEEASLYESKSKLIRNIKKIEIIEPKKNCVFNMHNFICFGRFTNMFNYFFYTMIPR
jgi:NTP pyrophosphatase (non-canonical NTP hydrolase)